MLRASKISCLFLEQLVATAGKRRSSSPCVLLILPEVGSHRAFFLFARHNLKFMSSRIGYTRFSLSLFHPLLFSLVPSSSSSRSRFPLFPQPLRTNVVSPQNLNIKISPTLMFPARSPPFLLSSTILSRYEQHGNSLRNVFIKYTHTHTEAKKNCRYHCLVAFARGDSIS